MDTAEASLYKPDGTNHEQAWAVEETTATDYTYPAKPAATAAVAAGSPYGAFATTVTYNPAPSTAAPKSPFVQYQGNCYQFTMQYQMNVLGVVAAETTVNAFYYDAADPFRSDWLQISCDGMFDETAFAADATNSGTFQNRGDIATGTFTQLCAAGCAKGTVVMYGPSCYRAKAAISAGDAFDSTATTGNFEESLRCLSTATRKAAGNSPVSQAPTFDWATFPYIDYAAAGNEGSGLTHSGNALDVQKNPHDGYRCRLH
jgi:hypothetical protein